MLHGDKKHSGFTLIELMITIVILAVLATLAGPSMNGLTEKNRLKRAAVEIQGIFAKAKAETVTRDIDLSVSMTDANTATGTWCVGYAAVADCDCDEADPTDATACAVNIGGTDVSQRVLSTEFPGVTLVETFGGGTYDGTTFDAVRGTASAGTVTLASGNWNLSVVVSTVGRIRICTPVGADSIGYPSC